MELSLRKKRILAAIVEMHIESGEPVGSKALCQRFENAVSSATIRNEMSELCELGLLEQKHTSGGRLPSHKGYRYYVDHLMEKQALSDIECAKIECMLTENATTPEKLLENASNVLSQLTNCATVFTTPADKSASIQKIELIPASKRTAILLLLTSSGILKNCVCRIDIEIDEKVRNRFNHIVQEHFIGTQVTELSPRLLNEIADQLGQEGYAIAPLLMALGELSQDAAEAKTIVEGQTNLLAYQDAFGNIYELMDFLRNREQRSQLVSYQRMEHSDMLSILIGSENYFREMENSSMILARYAFGAHEIGTLGIIGPTRIDYSKLIPNVQYLTGLVGRLLTETLEDPSDEE